MRHGRTGSSTLANRASAWSYFLAVVVGMSAALLAWFSAMAAQDAMATSTDKRWSAAAAVVSLLMAITFVFSWRSFWSQGKSGRKLAFNFSLAAVLGNLALAGLGLPIVRQAQVCGGDWGELAVGTAWVFTVIFPIALASASAGLAMHLRRGQQA